MRAKMLCVCLLLAACAAAEVRSAALPVEAADAGARLATSDFVSSAALTSSAANYLLELQPPIAAMPDNEGFRFEVRVAEASTRQPAEDVTLAVDAAMPEHGHGMNRVPRVTRLGDGHFLVEGMYFHMTGRWELYLDVTQGAWTERTQCRVELADE